MSTSTIEAKKEIINGAPKGATHYILLQHDLWEIYVRLEGVEFKTLIQGEWVTPDDFDLNEIGLYDLQSLAALQEIVDLHEQNIAMAAVIESQQKMLKQAQQEYIEQHSDGETDCVTPYDTYGLPKDFASALTKHKLQVISELKFPTMLRKMWSGSEVQQWLTEQASMAERKDAMREMTECPPQPSQKYLEALKEHTEKTSYQSYLNGFTDGIEFCGADISDECLQEDIVPKHYSTRKES